MVTGHRRVEHRQLVLERCVEVLERLEPAAAVSGGAEGADSLFAEAALQVGVPLHLVLPNRLYLRRYPAAVSPEVLDAAAQVSFVVERPDVEDWRSRWDAERWWVDNFARNAAMVEMSTTAVVVSPSRPLELAAMTRGGTAQCVKLLARTRPDQRVVWVPDAPAVASRWAPVR
jgi:hypothetical protein